MVRPIPYVNLAVQHRAMARELSQCFHRVLVSGSYILGSEVETFEREFAHYCGVDYAVGVNSGTDALMLAMKALGLGAGDEVLTPPNSYLASTSSIVLAGATPVFVDVGADMLIDPRKIPAAITPRTKAIMAVHLTGRPADMRAIKRIAQDRGLKIIEDCSQAAGAKLGGHPVGSFGEVGCFSLHPLKNLNAMGDAGIVVTRSRSIARRLRLLRNHGHPHRDECLMWSVNSRLDAVQAAILSVKLKKLDQVVAQRRQNASLYQEILIGIENMTVPVDMQGQCACYHTFIIQCDRRDELREFLIKKGVQTAIHYPKPIHLLKAAKSLGYGRGSFPMAEQQSRRILSLPIYPELRPSQIKYIGKLIRAFYKTE